MSKTTLELGIVEPGDVVAVEVFGTKIGVRCTSFDPVTFTCHDETRFREVQNATGMTCDELSDHIEACLADGTHLALRAYD